jgi:hypothetical protein
MRRLVFGIPLLALLAIPLSSGAGAPFKTTPSKTPALQITSAQLDGWSYSIGRLTRCEVGDGLAVLKDAADDPIRITAIRVLASLAPANEHWTFELMAFKSGSTTGEAAGSFELAALRGARNSVDAIGGWLAPVAQSGSWYVVVARVKLPTGHWPAWEVRGLDISYRLSSHSYSSVIKQSLHLPASKDCA